MTNVFLVRKPCGNFSVREKLNSCEYIDQGEPSAMRALRKRLIEFHANKPASYLAIESEAERLGWPESYCADLYRHDALTIDSQQPAAFLWAVRETGTDLLTGASPEYDATLLRHGTDSKNFPRRWYVWTGKTLVETSDPAKAYDRYVKPLLRSWWFEVGSGCKLRNGWTRYQRKELRTTLDATAVLDHAQRVASGSNGELTIEPQRGKQPRRTVHA